MENRLRRARISAGEPPADEVERFCAAFTDAANSGEPDRDARLRAILLPLGQHGIRLDIAGARGVTYMFADLHGRIDGYGVLLAIWASTPRGEQQPLRLRPVDGDEPGVFSGKVDYG